MSQPADSVGSGSSTRSRIQQVAVDLFAEQGYEATSLREIAECLGVTKAALYYHFKSKEEIVQSLVEDQARAIDELVAWAREQPRTLQTRQEIVRRYAASLDVHRASKVMRFLERNQTSLQKSGMGAQMRERMLELINLLDGGESTPAGRIRRSLAIMAMHAGWLALRDTKLTDEQRRAAALEVALELVE